jgi:hypothetical protein
MRQRKPDRSFVRRHERASKDAKLYNHVQKLLAEGCPKKTAAVVETAATLRCAERAVWTSLRRHEAELQWQAEEERRLRITLGEEEPTDEEIAAAGDEWLSFLDDLRRGK